MKENVVKQKSYPFAIKVVMLCKWLMETKKEFVQRKQLLRSGTGIGALVRESEQAESKPDFIHKLSIALNEANETEYWLCLLKDTGYISSDDFSTIAADAQKLLRLLTSIIKSAKGGTK